eukprot:COSAG01_NODE_43_length_32320_cov_622.744763_11_plen_512_part_00
MKEILAGTFGWRTIQPLANCRGWLDRLRGLELDLQYLLVGTVGNRKQQHGGPWTWNEGGAARLMTRTPALCGATKGNRPMRPSRWAALLVVAALAEGASGNGIFDAFFGGQQQGGQQRRRGRGGKQRGNDMTVDLQLELPDMYNGAVRSAQLNGKRKICDDCKGTGAAGGKVVKCRDCNGQGQVSKPMRMGPMMVQMQQPCDTCRGKGVTYKRACKTCGGSGIVPDHKALECKIEQGMLGGDTIVFKHEADVPNPDISPGDLIFRLNVNEKGHKFQRQDVGLTNDLRYTEEVTLREALLGFEHQIRHMDGHVLSFGSRGVTQPYQLRRIQGEGMPIRNSGGSFGDLIVEHRVAYPKRKISSEHKEVRPSLPPSLPPSPRPPPSTFRRMHPCIHEHMHACSPHPRVPSLTAPVRCARGCWCRRSSRRLGTGPGPRRTQSSALRRPARWIESDGCRHRPAAIVTGTLDIRVHECISVLLSITPPLDLMFAAALSPVVGCAHTNPNPSAPSVIA